MLIVQSVYINQKHLKVWKLPSFNTFIVVCFSELFYTERTHCRNLKILQNLFYKPMSQDPNISNDLIKVLFPNLEEMITLHGKFLLYNYYNV